MVRSARWVLVLLAGGAVASACGETERKPHATTSSAGADGGGHDPGPSTSGAAGAGGAEAAGSPPGGAGGAGAGGRTEFICEAPKLNPETGLIECSNEDGYLRRPSAIACKPPNEEPSTGGAGGAGGESSADPPELPRAMPGEQECESHEDCSAFARGYCESLESDFADCQSGCVTDSDCGEGRLCVCGSELSPTGGECRFAECFTDADCPGSICSSFDTGCGFAGFACLTQRDSCASAADCRDDEICIWSSSKQARSCDEPPICG